MKAKLLILEVVATLFFCAVLHAQSNTDKGIDLYRKGDYAGVINELKASDNYIDLYYLGLAYEKLDRKNDAKKTFGKSFRLGYKTLESEILSRPNSLGNKSESRVPLSIFLKNHAKDFAIATAGAQHAFSLKASIFNENEWVMKANFLRELNNLLGNNELAYSSDEITDDLKITSKPRPNFPHQEALPISEGTVILLVIFSKEGTVSGATPTKLLARDFANEAYKAAQKITFTPAMKDGRPVTTLRQIEYSFSTY